MAALSCAQINRLRILPAKAGVSVYRKESLGFFPTPHRAYEVNTASFLPRKQSAHRSTSKCLHACLRITYYVLRMLRLVAAKGCHRIRPWKTPYSATRSNFAEVIDSVTPLTPNGNLMLKFLSTHRFCEGTLNQVTTVCAGNRGRGWSNGFAPPNTLTI